jgi:hypothetical protein
MLVETRKAVKNLVEEYGTPLRVIISTSERIAAKLMRMRAESRRSTVDAPE